MLATVHSDVPPQSHCFLTSRILLTDSASWFDTRSEQSIMSVKLLFSALCGGSNLHFPPYQGDPCMCSISGSRIAGREVVPPGLSPRDQPQDAAPPTEHSDISVPTLLTREAAAAAAPFQRNGWVECWANLPLRLHELFVHRMCERGAAVVGDGEVTQLL